MADTDLELGAQARAAGHLIDAIGPIDSSIRDLANSIDAGSGGFKGASSAGLAQALTVWFTAAKELSPTLSEYATKLVQVDLNAAGSDKRAQDAFGRISGRLTGP